MLAASRAESCQGHVALAGASNRLEPAMTSLQTAADEFLAQHRIAVAGVSRDGKQPANLIYRRLRDTGHEVSPSTERRGGRGGRLLPLRVCDSGRRRPCRRGHDSHRSPRRHRRLRGRARPAGVAAPGMGPESTSDWRLSCASIAVSGAIPGARPCMFGATADPGHKCLRAMLRVTGKLPRAV